MKSNGAPRRQLGRELFSVVLAFGVSILIGRAVVQSIGSPPFIVDLVVFLLLYGGCYFLMWRVSERIFKKG